jgi:Ni/Co efflux regulator RcnB
MKRTLMLLAASAASAAPAFGQQADYCNPSGYVTGVYSQRDNPNLPCDPRQVPRVNGVPQGQPAPTARRHYNETQPTPDEAAWAATRDQRWRDGDRWREGNYYYGARGPEWQRGHRIPREYMARQYRVDNWRAHHLSSPPRGYEWVQVGNDYVLVALATGIIAQLLLAH